MVRAPAEPAVVGEPIEAGAASGFVVAAAAGAAVEVSGVARAAWADSAARPDGSWGPAGSPGTARGRGGAVPDAANADREVALKR
ncbi:hypothetical protein [Mycolicibacterium setense]|uniref:hypothetical protein n=1 Tax=Mycolicibacterium setense TaxID=431269 RepID=UPI000573DE30|nr:hypothetical protein [Mycolicibacterium setense]KHO25204.1 hypothetical protein QQ25_05950 [Mycolicibacterium setense]MCV7112360.1 hypothetical protein [Mycolicibacterium setense]